MPLIRIENWPGKTEQNTRMDELCSALREAVLRTKFPGIDHPSKVTLVLGGQNILPNSKTLVIIVEGLFDTLERTLEVRRALANDLVTNALPFMDKGWGVEVMVKRFNPDRDAYAIGKS